MSDVKLFIGGVPAPMFPNDRGFNEYREPHARRIAYEYATGYFTMGWPLNPSLVKYQREALQEAQLEVGDTIMLYAVPEEHLLTSVLARVDDTDARYAGAALKPTAMLYDAATGTYTASDVLDSLFDNLSLTEKSVAHAFVKGGITRVDGVDIQSKGDDDAWSTSDDTRIAQGATITTNGGFFVPTGKTLVLGFKVTAMPTDKTKLLHATQAAASLVAKVVGFDIPPQV